MQGKQGNKGKKQSSIIYSKQKVKVVVFVFTTIFLGALGSGLWEIFLKDVFNYLGNTLLKLIGAVYSGFLDNLHADIARGDIDRYSLFPYIMLIVIFCCMPWWLIVYSRYMMRSLDAEFDRMMLPDNNISIEERTERLIKRTGKLKNSVKILIRTMLVLAVIITLNLISSATRDVYATSGAIYLDCSIEIVAPYISSTDVLQLRAAFRSIKTTADFHSLDLKLKQIAENAKVGLPKFNSIGAK